MSRSTPAAIVWISGLLLTLLGMRGCFAAVGSIGAGSVEMSFLEAFGLLAGPFLLLGGLIVQVVVRRRSRRCGRK